MPGSRVGCSGLSAWNSCHYGFKLDGGVVMSLQESHTCILHNVHVYRRNPFLCATKVRNHWRWRRGQGARGPLPTFKSGGTSEFPPPTFEQSKSSNITICSYFVVKNAIFSKFSWLASLANFFKIFKTSLTLNSRIIFHISFFNWLTT